MSVITNLVARPLAARVILRPGTLEDAEACGHICHEAFTAVASAHGFPSDYPTPEVGIGLATLLLAHPGFFSVVAECDGRIVGSAFLDERAPVAGMGPVSVAPDAQNSGIGRLLMRHALDRVGEQGFAGVRLLQAAYHNRALGLFASLGFQVRDVVACMQGPAIGVAIPDRIVRPALAADQEACHRICRTVHGYERGGELRDAIVQGSAVVVERSGEITGYATAMGFLGHAVGTTAEDLEALIGATKAFEGPGILVPVRNATLFWWCLVQGLRVVSLMTQMSVGQYQESAGVYMPSVLS